MNNTTAVSTPIFNGSTSVQYSNHIGTPSSTQNRTFRVKPGHGKRTSSKKESPQTAREMIGDLFHSAVNAFRNWWSPIDLHQKRIEKIQKHQRKGFEEAFYNMLQSAVDNWSEKTKHRLIELIINRLALLGDEEKYREQRWINQVLGDNLSESELKEMTQIFEFTQKRTIQETTLVPFVSDKEYFFPNDLGNVLNNSELCFSGNEGVLMGITGTTQKIVLFTLENGLIRLKATESSLIASQLSATQGENVFASACENGHAHIVTYGNGTLSHAVIKNGTLAIPFYQAVSDVIPNRAYKPAKLRGDLAALGPAYNSGRDFYLLLTNSTSKFERTQFLNTNSEQGNIISFADGSLRVFQYRSTGNSEELAIVVDSVFMGLNHINNQRPLLVPNTPVSAQFVTLASPGQNRMAPSLITYKSSGLIISSRSLGTEPNVLEGPSIANCGPGNPNINFYARESYNTTTGLLQIKFDFVNATSNSTSIIGGEHTYNHQGMTVSFKPKAGCSNDTAIISFTDENGDASYVTIKAIDPNSIPTPTPISAPSSATPSMTTPSMATPTMATPTMATPSMATPSIESPSTNTGTPSITITIPPDLKADTFIPVTAEIITVSNNTVSIQLIDNKGFKIVFNANCSDVPILTTFSPEFLPNISLSLGNASITDIPVLKGCSASNECSLSVRKTPLQHVFSSPDDENHLEIILPVTFGGAALLMGIAAFLFWRFKFRPQQIDRVQRLEKAKEMKQRRGEQPNMRKRGEGDQYR